MIFSSRNKLIAVVCSVVCIGLSIGMFLPSREDQTLAYGAFAFLSGSLSLLWFSFVFFEKRQFAHKTVWFVLVAICIVGMIFPAFWITEKVSTAKSVAHEANFRNVRVTDVRDEPLVTEKNNPIGIRLHYTVVVPQSDRYSPIPSVSVGGGRVGSFYPVSVKINPLPQSDGSGLSLGGVYEAGVPYGITVDLVPNFLLSGRKIGTFCVYFADQVEENLAMNAEPQRAEIDIDGTSFNRYYGQGVHYLENRYALKDFYASIAKEDIFRCGP
jgi:hypothetical protein